MRKKVFGLCLALAMVMGATNALADSNWGTMLWTDGYWYLDTDGDGMVDSEDGCPTTWPVRRVRGGDGYASIQWLYDWDMQDFDVVQAQSTYAEGTLELDKALEITIEGGYNCDFTDNSGTPTTVQSLTFGPLSDPVVIDNIAVE